MNEKLQKAIEKRNEFLNQNPHMQEYQKVIDEALDKTPQHMRLEVISLLLATKLTELKNSCINLVNHMREIT